VCVVSLRVVYVASGSLYSAVWGLLRSLLAQLSICVWMIHTTLHQAFYYKFSFWICIIKK
jgi:hypothetical protein